MSIFLPFLDGGLSYDCASCGSKCCHGLGFGMRRDELVPLLARRPALAPFIHFGGGHINAIDLTDDGCYMLRSDGRCSIEMDEGRDAKPTICKLFPFTRAYRVGPPDSGIIVVEPHLLRCPLGDGRGQGVRHADVLADVAAMGDELPLQQRSLLSGLSDGWLEREVAARDATAAHLDDRSPLPLQSALAGQSALRLEALWAAWCASFDTGPLVDEAAAIARPLALLTPTLRMNLLFGNASAPYPRTYARLPAQLVATGFLTSLAVRAMGRPLASLRSLGEVFEHSKLVRELLVRWTEDVFLPSEESAPELRLPAPLTDAFVRLVDGLRGEARPLGERFDAAASSLPSTLRFPLLRALAGLYSGLRFARPSPRATVVAS